MELTAHFLRKGLVIYEVPISYRACTYAEGKKIHFKDGFLAAGAVARYRFRRPPERTGPAAHGAPDEPGVMRAVEGGATIHTLGLEDLATAHRYRRYLHGLLAPTWARPCSRSAPASATSPPSCWTATAWSSTTTTRSACAPSTSASASAPASRSSPPTCSSSRSSRPSTRWSPSTSWSAWTTTWPPSGPWPVPPSPAAGSCRARLPVAGRRLRRGPHLRRYTPTASATPSRPPAWPPRSSARSTSSAASWAAVRVGQARPTRPWSGSTTAWSSPPSVSWSAASSPASASRSSASPRSPSPRTSPDPRRTPA